MNNRILNEPQNEPVTIEEVKVFLRLDGEQENALLTQLIKTARRVVENHTGRALITQTHRVVMGLDECDRCVATLPMAPYQQLAAVPVLMVRNAREQVHNHSIDTSRLQARVTFPNYFNPEGMLQIDYVCGYGDGAQNVPEPLRQAILLLVADLYENRPGEGRSSALPKVVRTILDPYRIMRCL